MSWQIIKDLKEKRAQAFTAAQTLRDSVNKESRDLTSDEQKKHDELFAEVETYGRKIALEEKAAAMSEQFDLKRQVGRESVEGTSNMIGMNQKDYSRFSLLRAISRVAAQKPLDGIEAEVHNEYCKRYGQPRGNIYFPMDLPAPKKRYTGFGSTEGTGSVMTTTEDTLIDILRPTLLTGKLGVRFLTGLQGKVALPRKTTTATTGWVGEGATGSQSNPVLDQVLFQPKTITSYTDITRQYAELTSVDAESLVRDDLMRAIGVDMDKAFFNGSGSSNQPTGLLKTAGIGSVVSSGSVAITNAMVIALETAVADANSFLDDTSAYATTPKGRGFLKGRPRSHTSGVVGAGFVWNDNNEVNNYRAFASNVIPSNLSTNTNKSALIFGVWSEAVIGMWGALDITVDPYTGSSSGTIRVVALQDLDIQFRHAASFAACQDMDTAAGDDEYFA